MGAHRKTPFAVQLAVATGIGAAAAFGVNASGASIPGLAGGVLSHVRLGCAIKGNISENGRIYHLPGQRYYAMTAINPLAGERWFCSEEEARAAGWRKAKV